MNFVPSAVTARLGVCTTNLASVLTVGRGATSTKTSPLAKVILRFASQRTVVFWFRYNAEPSGSSKRRRWPAVVVIVVPGAITVAGNACGRVPATHGVGGTTAGVATSPPGGFLGDDI